MFKTFRCPLVLTLIFLLGTACGAASTEPRDAAPLEMPAGSTDEADRTVDESAPPGDDDTPAPALPEWEPGVYDRFIEVDGLERTFRLYVPKGYDAAREYPLLLVFHGGGGNGDKALHFGFEAMADDHGFIAVHPDGIENNWADGRGTTDAAKAGVDDVAFVRELISSLKTTLAIDPGRVFATGASNGGMFSNRLGCELSDDIAAIAPVISAMPSRLAPTCDPSNTVSVLTIHATDDPFIPFEGGDSAHERFPRLGSGGLVESAAATRDLWQDFARCSDVDPVMLEPAVPDDPTRVEVTTMDDCDDGTAVHYYVVHGMGHAWPGREAALPGITGPSTLQFVAQDVIWEFFEAHGR